MTSVPETITPLLDRSIVDEVVREWAVESGVRLRVTRQALSFTQEQVAQLAATTPETVCRAELGQLVPREHLRAALAVAVGRDVSDIWPPLTRKELIRRAAS